MSADQADAAIDAVDIQTNTSGLTNLCRIRCECFQIVLVLAAQLTYLAGIFSAQLGLSGNVGLLAYMYVIFALVPPATA